LDNRFLISHPLSGDSYFSRSVVYITNHSPEESFGFIINFKTLYCLRDFRPQIKNGNLPIFEGGPVGKNQLFYIHTLGELIPNCENVVDDICIGGDFEEILKAIEDGVANESNLKLLMGYSGWGPKQLDTELANAHWLETPADPKLLFVTNIDNVWKIALTRVKKSYGLFGDIGSQPSIN